MEIAVIVRRCGLVPKHKPDQKKKNEPNTPYNWKQLYRYVHSKSRSSYIIQEQREKEKARSRFCAPTQGGSCTEKTHSACVGWKRLSPLSSPKQVGISHFAHPLRGSPLARGQRLHLESIISVLGGCTEPLQKRKPEKQLRDECECLLTSSWPTGSSRMAGAQSGAGVWFFNPLQRFLLLSDSLVFVWYK